MVNPATTKRNKENRDNCQSKNDPKDALVIADVISRGFYYEYSRQAVVFQRLRTIMSDREYWVTNSVRLQNRIIRWIDIHFPEYFSVFKDWTCKRSMATLKRIPFSAGCRVIIRLRRNYKLERAYAASRWFYGHAESCTAHFSS
jgi:transposase